MFSDNGSKNHWKKSRKISDACVFYMEIFDVLQGKHNEYKKDIYCRDEDIFSTFTTY
jgi:hypothetical protein